MSKIHLFVNTFKRSAFLFYLLNTRPGILFDDCVKVLTVEYDSMTQNQTIQTQLESLLLAELISSRKIQSEYERLRKFVYYINLLHSQVPSEFESDAVNMRYICHTILDYECTQPSQNKIRITGVSFMAIFNYLQTDIQFNFERSGRKSKAAFLVNELNGQLTVYLPYYGQFYVTLNNSDSTEVRDRDINILKREEVGERDETETERASGLAIVTMQSVTRIERFKT